MWITFLYIFLLVSQGTIVSAVNPCSDPKTPGGVWQYGCLVKTCISGTVEESLAEECVELIEEKVDRILGEKFAEKGVIVSGGNNGYDMASTEVYFPSRGSGYTCSLQSLPSARSSHTLDQLGDGTVLACGGWPYTLETCDKFNGTSWSWHSTLLHRRDHHTSLPGHHDLLLMGGKYSLATTELVGGGEQYNLKRRTQGACGITEPGSDYIILTGGSLSRKTVAKYNRVEGFVSSLPDLNIERWGHGCGVFDTNTGQKVYVVAGGVGYTGDYLSSTELLYDGGLSWVTGQALPITMSGPASVSLADSVLLLGGFDGSDVRREILSLNSSLAWTVVGTLQEGRSAAAAAVVTFDWNQLDLSGCPE